MPIAGIIGAAPRCRRLVTDLSRHRDTAAGDRAERGRCQARHDEALARYAQFEVQRSSGPAAITPFDAKTVEVRFLDAMRAAADERERVCADLSVLPRYRAAVTRLEERLGGLIMRAREAQNGQVPRVPRSSVDQPRTTSERRT